MVDPPIYRSTEWRKPIKDKGGMTSLILEEGINDQSHEDFERQYLGVTEESISYVDKIFLDTDGKNKLSTIWPIKLVSRQDLSPK